MVDLIHRYRPQAKLRVGNAFAPVCVFTGGGWLPSMHHRPYDQHPGWEGWWSLHPGGLPTEGRAVRILLECFDVWIYSVHLHNFLGLFV